MQLGSTKMWKAAGPASDVDAENIKINKVPCAVFVHAMNRCLNQLFRFKIISLKIVKHNLKGSGGSIHVFNALFKNSSIGLTQFGKKSLLAVMESSSR